MNDYVHSPKSCEIEVLDDGCLTSTNSTSHNFDFGQLAEIDVAKLEIGRSRTDGVCFVASALSLFSVVLSFSHPFLFLFLVLTHLTLHFVFCSISILVPKNLNCSLNPKPSTHTFVDKRAPDHPKFRAFFSPANFLSVFTLWWSFSWKFGGVFEGRDPETSRTISQLNLRLH